MLPIDRGNSERSKYIICSREGLWSEKSTIRRKWTRMRWGNNMMLWWINESFFGDGIVPPEDKYSPIQVVRKCCNDCICEYFPSFSLMTRWLSWSDSQYGIEKEDSLLGPICEICTSTVDIEVAFELFEDVSETRLRWAPIRDGEWESHGCTWCMIGILSEYDDFYLIEWSKIECSENIACLRKALSRHILFTYVVRECRPVCLSELWCKSLMPRWVDADCHVHMMSDFVMKSIKKTKKKS